MIDEAPAGKGTHLRGWTILRIVVLAALAVALPLLIALATRLQGGRVEAPPLAQLPASASASATPTTVIPGLPVLCASNHDCSATPEPEPTLAAQLPPAAFGLAWFHKPPADGSSAATIAKEDRYIHLTGPSDIPFRDALRAAGFKGPIYTYLTTYEIEGPGPYAHASDGCDTDYVPYDNNLAWGVGDFCKYINPNESWFLHNGKGERIVEDYFGTGRYAYLMNPADPGWQAFSQQRLLYARDNWGYDGVWLDNLDLDLNRAANNVKNSDGRVKEYSDDAAWRTAMSGWLAGVRAKLGNWPIWANMVGGVLEVGSWDPYAPYLDGAMDESFAVRWLDPGERGWRSPDEWKAQVERAGQWLSAGKGLVMVGQGARDDRARLLFTLASYMLVANNNATFRYTRFDSYYDSLWLYPEYDTARALGEPLAPRQEISPGTWRRDFTNGYAEVDVAGRVGRLVRSR